MSTASERAWSLFPAGSPGEYNLPRELTVVLARGEGATVWDTEGRAFTDFTMGWGSVLLGHAHPSVVDAVRLARAHAGRPRVVKFEGAYHGANEVGTVSLFPQRLLPFPEGEPTSGGVPASAVADVLVAPYNDLRTTSAILAAHRHEVAAVIVEPLHRCTPPQPGFLAGLRELTTELGMLLIFDETVTGFRLAYGGAQGYYGVRPDLATFGKALGGGYPIGVVAGRGDVLDLVCEDRLGQKRYVWFASSVGGNAISATAALATLAELRRPGTYPRLFALGESLRAGLVSVLKDEGVTAQVQGDARSRRSCSPIMTWSTTAPRSTPTARAPARSCSACSAAASF